MQTRVAWPWIPVLLALVLAPGCRAPRGSSPPGITSPAGTPRASDAEVDRRARAMAAYGAGVIRESAASAQRRPSTLPVAASQPARFEPT